MEHEDRSGRSRALEGRHALVTGGGSGIGLACARRLAEDGARTTILGRASAVAAAADLRAEGLDVDAVECDLSDVAATRELAERLASEEKIDILVNNAGIIYREPAETHDPREWERVLDVNLRAVWALTQPLGAAMVERGFGRIVTIASLLSFQGGINVVSYATTKHAVVGMTKTLANEWASHGVTVNCIAPGYIATNNTTALREDEAREAEIRSRIPAGRWGTPDDVARAAAFLVGPDAGYVNGHTLVVDGGWLAR
jgi:2-deoxy-D-gluconate 3-dehydrogenase